MIIMLMMNASYYLKGENCDEKEVWVFDYIV